MNIAPKALLAMCWTRNPEKAVRFRLGAPFL